MEACKMTVKESAAQEGYQSEVGTTFHLASESGDRFVVAIAPTGRMVLRAEAPDEDAILGTIVVTGLTPEQVAQKSQGFWGRLWDKIKSAVNDIIDAITFESGPFTCRAGANVDYQSENNYTVTVQLTCRD
jgi:hypothetical protein